MRSTITALATVSLLALSSCNKAPPAGSAGTRTNAAQAEEASSAKAPSQAQSPPTVSDAAPAEVGKPAPDFTLRDLDGNDLRLSSFKGKVVVLEWFNPGCPFVKRAHTKGSLKEAAKKHMKNGVVWIAVNSGSPGKQGHGVDANREGKKLFAMEYPVLLDETGQVGTQYGATNTPHMFVIDDKGTLVYRGAIDNSPDGEGESAPNGKLVAYVDEALASIAAGRPVATAETKAYGCSVKYGKN